LQPSRKHRRLAPGIHPRTERVDRPIDQFPEGNRECAVDPRKITGWIPSLQQYPPGLLNVCESSDALAKQLVAKWPATYMLAGVPDTVTKGQSIANWLGDAKTHLSHGRPVPREDLVDQGPRL
jgi:hypothetical protein